MEMFRQTILLGGFVKLEPFFKSINCSSSSGYYSMKRSKRVSVGKGLGQSEGGFLKEGTKIADLPIQGKPGGETDNYSESHKETTT